MIFLQHLTKFIILSMYTVSKLTLDSFILSFNGFHLISQHVHTTYLHLIIVLFFLLYTQVVLRVQVQALFSSQCILSLCPPLLTLTLSYTIHLLMTYNSRCQLRLTKYPIYVNLCSHAYVMSMLGQLRTCLNLMTTRLN